MPDTPAMLSTARTFLVGRRRIAAWAAAILTLALVRPGAARAQEVSLSLDDAIARGLASAPTMAEAQARIASAEATVTARRADGLPLVSTAASYMRTNHIPVFGLPEAGGGTRILFPDIPNNYQLHGEVDVPIYTGGRVSALVSSASAAAHAAEADRTTTASDLTLTITRAYWALVTARQNVTVVQQSLARMDAEVSDTRARVSSGLLPPNEVLSAQAQRAREAVALIEAQNGEALASADLARLVGLDPGATIAPTSPIEQPLASATALGNETIDALVVEARIHRPERTALLERASEASAAAVAAGAAARPQVAATAAVQPARPNNLFLPRTDTWQTSWSAGVTVSWLVWDHGKAAAERSAAAAQADAVRDELNDFDRGVAVEVRQRLLAVQAGRAALAASADAVNAATEALRVVEERFRAGVATSTDELDAHVALLQAELERTQLAASLRVSEAELVHAVGGQ